MKQQGKSFEDSWTIGEILQSQHEIVSLETIEALEHAVTPCEWHRGDAVVEQNEICDKWIFIASGLHRIMFRRGKKTDTLFFGGGGDVFTSFHTLCDNKASIFRVEAMTDCHGWEISHYKYRMLQEQFPDLIKFELGMLRHQFYMLEDYYSRRGLLSAQERYERYWDQREGKLKRFRADEFRKYLPMKVVAQYLSMTPEMLSVLRRRDVMNEKGNLP